MFGWQARIIRKSPKRVLAVLGAVTLALLAGILVQDPPEGPVDSTSIFLPAGSDLAAATDVIRESFPASADLRVVQILAKGDVLAADSLRAIKDLQIAISSDPAVRPFLVAEPLYGYVQLIELAAAEAGLSLTSITDTQVSLGLAQLARDPQRAELHDLLERFLARDATGEPMAGLSLVILDDAGDALGQEQAQLRAHEIANSTGTGTLETSIITLAKSDAEAKQARDRNLVVVTLIALAVIVVLLAVFYRTQSDVHITMAGLGMTILWTLGAQAWLSPGGAGIVDPDNILLTLVPVLLISLAVDYALQITGRYREALRDDAERTGDASGRAIARSVRLCGVPVLLAAGTTAISLLANLTSRFDPIAEFGIIASIGVVSGWIVMTGFVPAARLVLDRRRATKGREPASRPIADTIPGAAAILPRIAAVVVRRPVPVLAGAVAVTVLAVVAAANLATTFAVKDFLPRDSEVAENIDYLDEHFDGSATLMTVLIETDLHSARAVRELGDLHTILVDPERRPDGIIGPPLSSAGTLLADWTAEAGRAGTNDAVAVVDAFAEFRDDVSATDQDARRAWELLEGVDAAGLAQVLDFRADGPDRTIIQIPVAVESNEALQELIDEIEALWTAGDGHHRRGAPGQRTHHRVGPPDAGVLPAAADAGTGHPRRRHDPAGAHRHFHRAATAAGALVALPSPAEAIRGRRRRLGANLVAGLLGFIVDEFGGEARGEDLHGARNAYRPLLLGAIRSPPAPDDAAVRNGRACRRQVMSSDTAESSPQVRRQITSRAGHGRSCPRIPPTVRLLCQRPVGFARWWTVELPGGGQQNCPVPAGSARM